MQDPPLDKKTQKDLFELLNLYLDDSEDASALLSSKIYTCEMLKHPKTPKPLDDEVDMAPVCAINAIDSNTTVVENLEVVDTWKLSSGNYYYASYFPIMQFAGFPYV